MHVTHPKSDGARVALTDETVAVSWDVFVAGELECEDCFTSDFVPGSGTVTTRLLGLPVETSRIGLDFTFATFGPQADVVAEISGGSLVVDGDQSRAATFSGPPGDQETV